MKRILTIICAAALLSTGCAGLGRNKAAYKAHITKGQRFMASESKYHAAVKEFTFALKLGEKMNREMIPTVMLGETYVRANEIGEASKMADRAVKKWPRESCAWELLGKVDLKRNRLKQAGESFSKAFKLARKKEDKKRIGSLISLTKGLRAYAGANIQSTKEHFAEIKSAGLSKDIKLKALNILGVNMAK